MTHFSFYVVKFAIFCAYILHVHAKNYHAHFGLKVLLTTFRVNEQSLRNITGGVIASKSLNTILAALSIPQPLNLRHREFTVRNKPVLFNSSCSSTSSVESSTSNITVVLNSQKKDQQLSSEKIVLIAVVVPFGLFFLVISCVVTQIYEKDYELLFPFSETNFTDLLRCALPVKNAQHKYGKMC